MTFGERLIKLRQQKGFATRNKFAEELGIPNTTLRNYETDAREPGHDFLILVSNYFNVSIDYLLGITDCEKKANDTTISNTEMEIIKKYRSLDERGKKIIESLLEEEYFYLQNLKKNESSKEVESFNKILGNILADKKVDKDKEAI